MTNHDRKESARNEIRSAFENKGRVEYIPPSEPMAKSNNEKHRLKVAVYCRVSTDNLNQAGSYELQIQTYKEYVSSHPEWELVEIYADGGISGTSTRHRVAFNKMIEDCKAGKTDMIITKSISRFARNVVDCVSIVRSLKSLNPPVAVLFEDVNINTLTQTGELLMVVMAALAQGESEAKSVSVKWGFRRRFEAGIPKISPLYGFEKDGRNLYVNETEAAVVRLMFQMFDDGYSISDICVVLNSRNILSPKGVQWSYSTVKNILHNEKYCGDVIMQKTVCVDMFSHRSVPNTGQAGKYKMENYHAPIVEKTQWERIQKKLEKNKSTHQDAWRYWLEEQGVGDERPAILNNFIQIKNRRRGK